MTSNQAINSVINAQAAAVQQQIGFAIAAKGLSVTKQQGEAAIQLLEAATQLSKAVGKGNQFDAVA